MARLRSKDGAMGGAGRGRGGEGKRGRGTVVEWGRGGVGGRWWSEGEEGEGDGSCTNTLTQMELYMYIHGPLLNTKIGYPVHRGETPFALHKL